VAPVVLGPAAAAYLASVAGRGSAAAWVAARLGQVRHVVKGQHAAVVAASVATITLVAVALAMGGHSRSASGPDRVPSAPPSVTAPSPTALGASAPVLPAPARTAAPASHPAAARIHAPAVPPPVSSSLPQTLSQPQASPVTTFAPPAESSGRPRPVSLPAPAAPESPSGASSTPQAPPAPPASAPAVTVVPDPGPPLAAATIPAVTVPAVTVPAVTIPAQGGTSILGLTLTLPVVGVQVSANVSLPGGISLGIGGDPGTPGTTSAGNWTSAG
jgi:hypothetical protein